MDYNNCPNLNIDLPLATAFIPIQKSNEIYESPAKSMEYGTVFPVLAHAGYHQPEEDMLCHTNR